MLKFRKKVPIIIMSLLLVVITLMTNSVMATETKVLPDRLIRDGHKEWTLSLPFAVEKSLMEESVNMTTKEEEKEIPVTITVNAVEGTNNFQITPENDYVADNIYKLIIGQKVFESYGSPRSAMELSFRKVEMDVSIESGLTAFQRLVKVKLPKDYTSKYNVMVMNKQLTYKESLDIYIGLVDSSDEVAIDKEVVVTKKPNEQGDK